MFFIYPSPRQELVEPVDGMSIDHLLKHITQISVWFDAVEPRGFDQGTDGRPPGSAAVRTGEEMILTSQRHRPDGSFDGIPLHPVVPPRRMRTVSDAHRSSTADHNAKRCVGKGLMLFDHQPWHRRRRCTSICQFLLSSFLVRHSKPQFSAVFLFAVPPTEALLANKGRIGGLSGETDPKSLLSFVPLMPNGGTSLILAVAPAEVFRLPNMRLTRQVRAPSSDTLFPFRFE